MKQGNFFTDNSDIMFHAKKRLDFPALFSVLCDDEKEAVSASTADEYAKSWFDALDTLGQICSAQIAPQARKVDEEKIKLIDGKAALPSTISANIETLAGFGISAFGISPEFGGMGAPFIVEMIGCEMMNRADPATTLNVGWYSNIAHVIEQFGDDSVKTRFIPKLASGEMSGNMALTEADAGSDLGAIKTYGEPNNDGSWKLYGSKRFITNGNGELSLVLAKAHKGAEGLNSLCLFACPRTIDGKENIKILKLEDKIGLHGSATAELAYDGAQAWLLGKEGEGFAYMLRLMNDSRIGVGFQGIGLMEATWQLARDYAQERRAWGKPIAQHELIAEKLLDLEVELRATRSLGYQAAFKRTLMYATERYLKKNPDLSKKKMEELKAANASHTRYVRKRTPLLKYWVGERSVMHARTCMQIFGGYGYTTEYRPEWWVRESLIYSLYEGTSQIQALMCLKDTLKFLVRSPGTFAESVVAAKVKGLSETDPLRRKLFRLKQVTDSAIVAILLKLLKANAKSVYKRFNTADVLKRIKDLSGDLIKFDNLQPALLHAERLCEIQCYEYLAEAVVNDAMADKSRRWIAERFLHNALPKAHYLKTLIDCDDPVIEGVLLGHGKAATAPLSETGTA